MSNDRSGKKHFFRNSGYLIIIILFSFLCFIYLLVYFSRFHHLSNQINDYSAFATYLGGLGSIASIGTLIVVLIESNKIQKEKIKENRQKNTIFLVEHFEIAPFELNMLTSKENVKEYIDGTEEHGPEYSQILGSIYDRINYLFHEALLLNDFNFMNFVKFAVINKMPGNILDLLYKKYSKDEDDNDCIRWLVMDSIRWRLNR
jgi:hypothetical protein